MSLGGQISKKEWRTYQRRKQRAQEKLFLSAEDLANKKAKQTEQRANLRARKRGLEWLKKVPKTSAERVREYRYRARKSLLKQQQEPDAIVATFTQDIRAAGLSEDNQVPGRSEIRKMEKQAKSLEAIRRRREKSAQRMQKYRERQKLKAKKQQILENDPVASTSNKVNDETNSEKQDNFKQHKDITSIVRRESNCSSKQFGTEDSSAGPSKHQDESRDFEYSVNFVDDKEDDNDDEEEEDDDGPIIKKRKLNGQDTALEDALQCIKTLIGESEKRDEYASYGEYVAHKIRNCNRSSKDVTIAQHHIENIIFNLTMGVYNQDSSAALEDKSHLAKPPVISHVKPVSKCFQPIIIPKSEPTL